MPEAWLRFAWLMLLCATMWHPVVRAQAPLRLTTAQTLAIDGYGYTAPPYEARAADLPGVWQSVALPHALSRQLMPNTDQSNTFDPPTVVTWYYLKLPELAVSASPRYIYIPRWKTDGQFALYGDGRLLYQSHASTYWNGWNTPLWIAVDETADAVTPREILIRIERPRDTGGGISSVWLGDEASLGWRYRIRYGLQIQLPAANSAAFLAVGTFALLLWLRLRRETMYLLFFGISLASFLRTLHFHVGEIRLPVSDAWFTWLTINALYWLLLITHLFLNYLHGRPMVWLNRSVIGVTALMGLITLPAFSELLNAYALSPLIYAALLLMGSTVSGVGLYQSRRAHARDGQLLAGWGVLGMLLGAYDWLLQNNHINVENIYLGPYANVVAFLIFVYIMFHRYVAAHEAVRQAKGTLETRLQAQEAELLESHRKLRKIERRQTLADERQRLMQDMHDGMGSSLRTALLTVEKGRLDAPQVADVLRDCLDDLKLAIDAMEPVQADLLLLLATLRYRLGPRLESAGITLRWDIEDVPALEWLDPRNSLHILRILQEAFTNIIKHTQATEIQVKTHARANWVEVTVTDNGQGFDVEQAFSGPGKGIVNQRHRAESIGAEIVWNSSPAGTCLGLRLPVRR
jgi:signal transduction histidine kinase